MEGYLAAAGVLLAGILLVTAAMVARRLLAPRAVTETGLRTYESGVDPVGAGWAQSRHLRCRRRVPLPVGARAA